MRFLVKTQRHTYLMQNSISDRMQVTRNLHYFFSSRFLNFYGVVSDQKLPKLYYRVLRIFENLWTFNNILGVIQVLRYHFLAIFYPPVTMLLPSAYPPVVTLPPSTLRNLIPKGQFIENMCIFMFFAKFYKPCSCKII